MENRWSNDDTPATFSPQPLDTAGACLCDRWLLSTAKTMNVCDYSGACSTVILCEFNANVQLTHWQLCLVTLFLVFMLIQWNLNDTILGDTNFREVLAKLYCLQWAKFWLFTSWWMIRTSW